MARQKSAGRLVIDGRDVAVTNLQKVLYPDNGFTKAQVIDYYIRVSEYLLPHLRNRPVILKRYPDGALGDFYYERDAPANAPDWIERFPVPRRAGGPDIQYIVINNLATLVWCANTASLEFHPFLHCVPELQRPTSVVFDLDPGEGADVLTCAEVAFLLNDILSDLALQCFVKVSGLKGIQVYVPLNGELEYAATQPFARAVAELLAHNHPKLIVAEMTKSERNQKVFIDWSQNADFKTTVGVYSLRAKRSRPFVSLPVTWIELESALRDRKSESLYFEPEAALKRLEQIGDLFAPLLVLKQALPESVTKVAAAKRSRKVGPALREYERKRDFSKTLEPRPEVPRVSQQGSKKRFVVQRHEASHLHYDFRLEMHGVLKSWAVPKGIPYELNQRRLAMGTEDHPIDYLDFEGTIPEGQYGGGTVMVWDIGTFELVEGNYYKGDLQIYLQGKKSKGEWHLTKDRSGKSNRWFLVKTGSAAKPPSARKENTSALTGRTMQQIAADKDAQWHSNRTSVPGLDLDKLPLSEMRFVEPMLAKPVTELPQGADWQYEIKLDGYRAIALKDAGTVRLISRRDNVLNDEFPEIVAAVQDMEDGLILDGEIVALDAQGRPSFTLLQHRKDNAEAIAYYAFDAIAYRRRDLRGLPLRQRRDVLKEVFKAAHEPIRISPVIEATPDELISAVRSQGLEGIVAKRWDGRYESGERSGQWVKFRVNRGQELVIAGYRPGKDRFDALAAGYYDDTGRLIFAAKVKNGFTPEVKRQIFDRFAGLETPTCPFDNLPEPKDARWGEALTPAAMKKFRWLTPKLVAQVEFTDWTSAHHLRHARFVGLRDDKDAKDVFRES